MFTIKYAEALDRWTKRLANEKFDALFKNEDGERLMEIVKLATGVFREEIAKDAQDDTEKALRVRPLFKEGIVRVSSKHVFMRMSVGDDTRNPSGTLPRIKRRLRDLNDGR